MKAKFLAAVKTWIVIYPSITILLFLFGRQLAAMPLYIRTLLLTVVLVPWMMFVGIPAVNALLGLLKKLK